MSRSDEFKAGLQVNFGKNILERNKGDNRAFILKASDAIVSAIKKIPVETTEDMAMQLELMMNLDRILGSYEELRTPLNSFFDEQSKNRQKQEGMQGK